MQEQSTPSHPGLCSLLVLASRDVRLLFLTDGSSSPELCIGSPAQPWRWWELATVAPALDQDSPIAPRFEDPEARVRRLSAWVINNYPALAGLFARRPYRAAHPRLRVIERQLHALAADRAGVPMKPDDPRRKWYSLRTLGGRRTA